MWARLVTPGSPSTVPEGGIQCKKSTAGNSFIPQGKAHLSLAGNMRLYTCP